MTSPAGRCPPTTPRLSRRSRALEGSVDASLVGKYRTARGNAVSRICGWRAIGSLVVLVMGPAAGVVQNAAAQSPQTGTVAGQSTIALSPTAPTTSPPSTQAAPLTRLSPQQPTTSSRSAASSTPLIHWPVAPPLMTGRPSRARRLTSFSGQEYVTTARIGANTYALVTATLENGVQIVDITDPANPVPVASFGLRGVDNTGESGTVEIYAISDTGARFGPSTFTLNAWEAVEFELCALVRSPDGMLSAVHGAGRTRGGVSAKSHVALPGNWVRQS